MPLHTRLHRGLIVVLLFFGLTLLTPLAAHKKRKAAEGETTSKNKAKPTQKVDPKQLAKTARESRKEEERHKKQLAQKKKDDEKEEKKRSKQLSKVTAKQREEKTNDKSHGKDKAAKREADKKNDKAKDKLAKREADKKNERADKTKDKTKDKLTKREADKKLDKKELAAKKSPSEKDAKHAKAAKEAEVAEAKAKAKGDKPNSKAKSEEKREEFAKQLKIAGNSKSLMNSDHNQESTDKAKVLPANNFTLRPVAKALSKVELKFTVARAVALTSFDAPPPRDTGPDVIDVIEHNSPDAKRLDDVFRSEMKSPQFSSVPNISHKKLDVGKMEGERIRQIQEALAKKGYYLGEISGQYNEATIEAMRKFQEEHRVDVTGYATAQSLKLLGLTDW